MWTRWPTRVVSLPALVLLAATLFVLSGSRGIEWPGLARNHAAFSMEK